MHGSRVTIRLIKLGLITAAIGFVGEGLFEVSRLAAVVTAPPSVPGQSKILEHFALQHLAFPILPSSHVAAGLARRSRQVGRKPLVPRRSCGRSHHSRGTGLARWSRRRRPVSSIPIRSSGRTPSVHPNGRNSRPFPQHPPAPAPSLEPRAARGGVAHAGASPFESARFLRAAHRGRARAGCLTSR